VFLEPDDERMNLDDYDQILISDSTMAPLHHIPHELDLGESSTRQTVSATTVPVLPAFTTHNRFQMESSMIKYALEQISTKLQERMKIRRLEIAFGLRKKTDTTWDEYIQLSKSHPKLWTTHMF